MGSGGDTSNTSGSARAVVVDMFGKSTKHEKFDPGKTGTSNVDTVRAGGDECRRLLGGGLLGGGSTFCGRLREPSSPEGSRSVAAIVGGPLLCSPTCCLKDRAFAITLAESRRGRLLRTPTAAFSALARFLAIAAVKRIVLPRRSALLPPLPAA